MSPPGETSQAHSGTPANGPKSPRPSPAGPLFVWLVIQMAVLVVAAQRVPLSARFPTIGERLAVHEMLVTQVVVSALLFPWLLRDGTTAVLIAACAIPFVHLAAHLAGVSHPRAFVAAMYVVGWIAALAMWRPVLVQRRASMIGVTIAALLSVGGALLTYFRAEYSTDVVQSTTSPHLGPIIGALAELDPLAPRVESWEFLAVLLTSSLIAMLAIRRGSFATP